MTHIQFDFHYWSLTSPPILTLKDVVGHILLFCLFFLRHWFSHPQPCPQTQVLPGMSHGEAPPLSDVLVYHQSAEESRGAPGGEFGRGGSSLSSHHPWYLGRLQLQVHVLLERPYAGVHVHAQLVGGHACRSASGPRDRLCFSVVPPQTDNL